MSSKILFFPMLFVLAVNYFTTLSAAAGAPPVIHVISAMTDEPPLISINIEAGDFSKGSAQLRRGQDYEIKVDDVNTVYFASAQYGLKFASFHAYEPARDKGKAAVFWRADSWGFWISYDKVYFEKVEPWESE